MPGPKTEQTWEDTKKFYKNGGAGKAVKAGLEHLGDKLSGGMVGAAAEKLGGRKGQIDKQESDAVNDPTSVEYGGNRGSSTRNADGSPRNNY